MSVSFQQMRAVLRTRARTLVAATTGSASLGAAGAMYTRAAGSFIADGFAPGMELTTVTGFTDTARSVITAVAAGTMTVSRTLATETASLGRTLIAGLPSRRHWEGRDFIATAGAPFMEESFPKGPMEQRTTGPTATVEGLPVYVLKIAVPKNNGTAALDAYATAALGLFEPNTSMVLGNGDTIWVKGKPGPFASECFPYEPSWEMVAVSIPLRLLTRNAA